MTDPADQPIQHIIVEGKAYTFGNATPEEAEALIREAFPAPDHQARMREIAHWLVMYESSNLTHVTLPQADLRYLLDRVRAQDERIEALEAAVAKVLAWAHGYSDCRDETGRALCQANMHNTFRILAALLPAPETVETQGTSSGTQDAPT